MSSASNNKSRSDGSSGSGNKIHRDRDTKRRHTGVQKPRKDMSNETNSDDSSSALSENHEQPPVSVQTLIDAEESIENAAGVRSTVRRKVFTLEELENNGNEDSVPTQGPHDAIPLDDRLVRTTPPYRTEGRRVESSSMQRQQQNQRQQNSPHISETSHGPQNEQNPFPAQRGEDEIPVSAWSFVPFETRKRDNDEILRTQEKSRQPLIHDYFSNSEQGSVEEPPPQESPERRGCVICANVIYGGVGVPGSRHRADTRDIAEAADLINSSIVWNFFTMNHDELIRQAVKRRRELVEEPFYERTKQRIPAWTEENLRDHLFGRAFGCNNNALYAVTSVVKDVAAVHAHIMNNNVLREHPITKQRVVDMGGVRMMNSNLRTFKEVVQLQNAMFSTFQTQVSNSLVTNNRLPLVNRAVTPDAHALASRAKEIKARKSFYEEK
jgi:hypothetical protein